MARSLRIITVAEGVETFERAGYLRAWGCNIGHGFLFGRLSAANQVPAHCKAQGETGYPSFAIIAAS